MSRLRSKKGINYEIFDLNYQLILSLAAEYCGQEPLCLSPVASPAAIDARLTLNYMSRSRYTDVLKITLDPGLGKWSQPIVLEVMVYHDLQCAEVTGCGGERLRNLYPCPNQHMFVAAEKTHINEWLCEWMTYCHNALSQSSRSSG